MATEFPAPEAESISHLEKNRSGFEAQGHLGPNILGAMVEVQKALESGIAKDREAFTFSYMTLDQIMDTLRQPLAKAGCFIASTEVYAVDPERGPISTGLERTRIYHAESCEFIEAFCQLRGAEFADKARMSAIQVHGANRTYALRYNVRGLFALGAGEDNEELLAKGGGREKDPHDRRGDNYPARNSGPPKGSDPPPPGDAPKADPPVAIDEQRQNFLKVISKGRAAVLSDEKLPDGKSKWGSVGELDPHDEALTALGYTKPDSENEGKRLVAPGKIAAKSFDAVVDAIKDWTPEEPAERPESDTPPTAEGTAEEESREPAKGEELPT